MKKNICLLAVLFIVLSCKEVKTDNIDEIVIVNDIFKEILNQVDLTSENKKITIDDYLRPLKTEDLRSLKVSDLYLNYDLENKKENLQVDSKRITNFGNYILIKNEPNNDATSKLYFSRVYFNENKKKGILIFEIFCGEYCYEKKIIKVEKDKSSGDWVVTDTNTLEVA